MARKKVTTYVDEELLRSAKILAAKSNGKIYEVFRRRSGATWRKCVVPKLHARRRAARACTRRANPGL